MRELERNIKFKLCPNKAAHFVTFILYSFKSLGICFLLAWNILILSTFLCLLSWNLILFLKSAHSIIYEMRYCIGIKEDQIFMLPSNHAPFSFIKKNTFTKDSFILFTFLSHVSVRFDLFLYRIGQKDTNGAPRITHIMKPQLLNSSVHGLLSLCLLRYLSSLPPGLLNFEGISRHGQLSMWILLWKWALSTPSDHVTMLLYTHKHFYKMITLIGWC